MTAISQAAPQPATDPAPGRAIVVEFLYLDDQVCGRCRETGRNLDAALDALAAVLAATGVQVTVDRRHVRTEDEARALGFMASPTIRVDGRDIQPEPGLDRCEDCGSLCGCDGGIDCRLWRWRGERYTAAPVPMIMEAILATAFAPPGRATKRPFVDGN